jgi:hypothetical protein
VRAGNAARVNAPGPGTGLTPAGWLQALTGTAADAMAADLAAHGKDWPRLWAFCCGLAGEESAEVWAAEAAIIADRGLTPVPSIPVSWYRPTEGGEALVARDAYDDRFLLVAPFSDRGQPAAPAATAELAPCAPELGIRLLAGRARLELPRRPRRGGGRAGADPRRVGTGRSPDERVFYACSPHRIETCASLLRDL